MSFSKDWLKSRFLNIMSSEGSFVFNPKQEDVIKKYGIDITSDAQSATARRFRLNFGNLYSLLLKFTSTSEGSRELNFYVGFKRAVDKDLQDELAREIAKTDSSHIYFHGFYCFSAQIPHGKSKEDVSFVFVSYNTEDEYSRGIEETNLAFIPLSSKFGIRESEFVEMLSSVFSVFGDLK